MILSAPRATTADEGVGWKMSTQRPLLANSCRTVPTDRRAVIYLIMGGVSFSDHATMWNIARYVPVVTCFKSRTMFQIMNHASNHEIDCTRSSVSFVYKRLARRHSTLCDQSNDERADTQCCRAARVLTRVARSRLLVSAQVAQNACAMLRCCGLYLQHVKSVSINDFSLAKSVNSLFP